MLPQTYPNYKSVHRRFQTWCRDEVLRRVLMDVANELRDKGALDEAECFIDATFVMAKGGGAGIGPTKRGKGMKIMAIVDRHGLPLSVSTHAANHHEVRLVQLCFDFYMEMKLHSFGVAGRQHEGGRRVRGRPHQTGRSIAPREIARSWWHPALGPRGRDQESA